MPLTFVSRLCRAFLPSLAALGLIATARATEPDSRMSRLASVVQPDVEITRIETLVAGTFIPPDGSPSLGELPAFCRVAAILRPAPTSEIHLELWLPTATWNGQFLGTGTGGGAGVVAYRTLARGIQRGFATVNTDLGTAPRADAAFDKPSRWQDFGGRATHLAAVVGKALTTAFYGAAPRRSYFFGASTGGQQALREAQAHPEDYDGIMAGMPANNRTHLHAAFVWNWRAFNDRPGSALSAEDVARLTAAIVASVGGRDGGAPGDAFLTDPRVARLDPKTLQVGEPKGFLRPAQVAALTAVYAGVTNPRTGERIYTSLPLGSEASPAGLLFQQDPTSMPNAHFYPFRWALGSDFDPKHFDFDHDMDRVDERLAGWLNANATDLSAFARRGGRLLMFSGTADPLVPFQDALDYYERVVASTGGLEATQAFFRYFVVPGMAHGANGPGIHELGQSLGRDIPADADHDILCTLQRWVEDGVAPDRLIATSFRDAKPAAGVKFRRPVYPYPLFPHYRGGDPARPESYEAVAHPRGSGVAPARRYLD